MASDSEWQDPFLAKPDQPTRTGKPIDAPPPMGPRFDGPPLASSVTPQYPPVDSTGYSLNAPPGLSYGSFSRTWRVTFRRWGRAWLAFAALGMLAGAILASVYPSPTFVGDGGSTPYYIGSFIGAVAAYLLLFGWWLDHVLASSGPVISLIVQGLVAGGVGLMGGSGSEGANDPLMTIPLFYFALVGVASVALAHAIGNKVEGSFKPEEEPPYSSDSM